MDPREKEIYDALNQQIEIPDVVWEKANEAFAQVKHISGKEQRKSQVKPPRRIWQAAAAAALLLTGSAVFLAANPTLAARLPIIGKIFEKVEKDATFSGDYSEKANVITRKGDVAEVVGKEAGKAAAEAGETYTVSNQGMTMTASEVYCDGLAVYLTFQVEYEGDLGTIPSYATQDGSEGAQIFYSFGQWAVNGEDPIPTENNYLEGRQIGEHEFQGMMRLDLSRFAQVETPQTLELQLDRLGADNMDVDSSQMKDIDPELLVEGHWDFTIPLTVDREQVQTMEVQEVNDTGYGLESVTVSPYQVSVFTRFPGSDMELTAEKRGELLEELRKKYAEKEGMAQEEIEAYLASLTDADILYFSGEIEGPPEVAAFTQDGERLWPYGGMENEYTFAVQGKELESVTIYVGASDDFALVKARTPEEAAAASDYFKTISLKE